MGQAEPGAGRHRAGQLRGGRVAKGGGRRRELTDHPLVAARDRDHHREEDRRARQGDGDGAFPCRCADPAGAPGDESRDRHQGDDPRVGEAAIRELQRDVVRVEIRERAVSDREVERGNHEEDQELAPTPHATHQHDCPGHDHRPRDEPWVEQPAPYDLRDPLPDQIGEPGHDRAA